jgi:hypothetical protein
MFIDDPLSLEKHMRQIKLVAVSLSAYVASSALADGTWQNIVSTTDASVQGVPGAVWVPSGFNNPTIDPQGRVIFRGELGGADITTANRRVIVRGVPGTIEIMARDSAPVPGNVPASYLLQSTTGVGGIGSGNNITANGGIVIGSSINGPGGTTSNDTATYFLSASGVPSLLIREGSAYPGGGGATMTGSYTASSGMRVSNDGLGLWLATLTGGDVSGTTNNTALLRLFPSGATVVHRKGSLAPGFDAGSGVTMTPSSFGLNVVGAHVEFPGTLVGSSITTSNDSARFTTLGAPAGQLRMWVREGQTLNGLAGLTVKPTSSISASPIPIVGGKMLFLADLAGDGVIAGVDDKAIMYEQGGNFEILLRRGQAMPGAPSTANGTLTFFSPQTSSFVANSSGLMAFQGIYQYPDGTSVQSPDPGTFIAVRKPDGTLITIARQGEAVPGISGDTFGSWGGNSGICVSENGIVAFGNTTTGSRSSVFAWDEADGLRLLAKAGDTNFTGTAANEITLMGSTGINGDGGFTGLSSNGWLAVRATDTANSINTIARIKLGNEAPSCPADLDDDGSVGGTDLATLLAQWGTNGSADLNGDGTVNAVDLSSVLAAWGTCP